MVADSTYWRLIVNHAAFRNRALITSWYSLNPGTHLKAIIWEKDIRIESQLHCFHNYSAVSISCGHFSDSAHSGHPTIFLVEFRCFTFVSTVLHAVYYNILRRYIELLPHFAVLVCFKIHGICPVVGNIQDVFMSKCLENFIIIKNICSKNRTYSNIARMEDVRVALWSKWMLVVHLAQGSYNAISCTCISGNSYIKISVEMLHYLVL